MCEQEKKLDLKLYPTTWRDGALVRRIQISSRGGRVSFYLKIEKVFAIYHIDLTILKIKFKGNERGQFVLQAPLARVNSISTALAG